MPMGFDVKIPGKLGRIAKQKDYLHSKWSTCHEESDMQLQPNP